MSGPPSDPETLAIPYVVPSSLPPDPARHQKQLAAIMDIAWAVSSNLDLDSLLPRVMQKVTEIINSDRTTFFVIDRGRGELWSKVMQGAALAEIRLRIGEGIAGWVAQSGQVVNLADAYLDSRFNRDWDERSGYRTHSLICLPVYDRGLNVIAVIQCLNKRGRRRFDAEDEELLRCVSGQCAVALESAFLYEAVLQRNRALHDAEARLRRANAELELLYDLERRISDGGELSALLGGLLQHACGLLGLEAAAVLQFDAGGGQWTTYPPTEVDASVIGSVEALRASLSQVRGAVHAVPGESGAPAVIVPSTVATARETFSAPLRDGNGPVGLLQLINRLDGSVASEWIVRMVSLLATQVSRAIVLRRERQASERAERLALLGHSVGALLHDMRTPLTAVGGYADLMAAEDDGPVRREYVGRIERALQHMETMAHEVLAFARGQREILVAKVYVSHFVESVREMLSIETQRAGVELVVEMSYDGAARFDESKIKRVLFNLARNACQAMPRGGRFTWRIKHEHERLVFECQDNGPGVPKEMLGRLFESFATHGKAGGTGLGLAMAKKIVEAHCGRIECHSDDARGALFRIELPG